MNVKNINQLKKSVEKMANQSIQKKNSFTKQLVMKTAKDRVDSEVYTYDPKIYERTGKLKESWRTRNVPNGILLENTYEDDGTHVIEVVETGEGYDYTGYGYEYENPRPVVAKTRDDLDDGRLLDAVKKDFISNGLDIK